LAENKIPNACVRNGVKHAHPVVKNFDIAVNNEPNGHGTTSFNKYKVFGVLDVMIGN